jgi:hypothetical protein
VLYGATNNCNRKSLGLTLMGPTKLNDGFLKSPNADRTKKEGITSPEINVFEEH